MADRQLKTGVVGLGLGAARIVREMELSDQIQLCAAADNDPEVLERFHGVFPHVKTYDTIEKLAADPEVEAVWLATPNLLHSEHAILLAQHGKHIMVQKPMAVTMQQAEDMVEAAEKYGVRLLAGHSQAYAAWIRLTRQIVQSGELGKLRAINTFAYNNWLMGTRKIEDLDPQYGGGIVFRNAPHQIDCIRLIGGGLLKSIRGSFGAWVPERPWPGYYSAYMEFTDGTPAVAIQNSYGYFAADEMEPTGLTAKDNKSAKTGRLRASMRDGTRNEAADYAKQGIGRSADFGEAALDPNGEWMGAWYANDLGIIVISCERGDIRQSPHGVYVYDDNGMREIHIPRGQSPSTWYLQLRELYRVVVEGGPAFQDGRWGMATLEVAIAVTESATTHKEVELKHQVALHPAYDDPEFAIHPNEIVQLA